MDCNYLILKEAGILYSRYGIKAVTMDQIANSIGISKRTLYEHFKDKNTLVKHTLIEGLRFHKKQLEEIIDNNEDILYAFLKVGSVNNKIFKKINPLFFEDLKKYYRNVLIDIEHNGSIRDYTLTKKILTRCENQGLIRSEVNISLFNIILHKLMDTCSSPNEIDENKDFNQKQINNTVFLPLIRGVCTEKGLEKLELAIEKINKNNQE